jgi:hypothetical protein
MKRRIYGFAAIVTAAAMYPMTNFSEVEEVVGFLVVILAGCALGGYVGNWLYDWLYDWWSKRTR